LAWAYQKVNALMERVGKGFLKLLFGKKEGAFFGKRSVA
jgi:hypothetical protein